MNDLAQKDFDHREENSTKVYLFLSFSRVALYLVWQFKYIQFVSFIFIRIFYYSLLFSVTEKPRGFLVLQKSSDQPTLLFRLSKAFNVMHPIDKVFACFIENASDIMKQQVSDDVSTETVIVVFLSSFVRFK